MDCDYSEGTNILKAARGAIPNFSPISGDGKSGPSLHGLGAKKKRTRNSDWI
jgi:hypothetical protein